MKQKIKFNQVQTVFNKETFEFTDYTRDVQKIPDDFFESDKFNTIFVDDDMTFDLCSLAVYGTIEYAELIMIYNKIYNPLVLPKNENTMFDQVDSEFAKYLNKFNLQGNDDNVPDLKFEAGIWYEFVLNESLTANGAQEQLNQIEEYNKRISDTSTELSLLEEKYESIKDDSDVSSFYRKKIRQDIEDLRSVIFKYQEKIVDIELEGIQEKGMWIPIRLRDLESKISAKEQKLLKMIYNKVVQNVRLKNEEYRYLKYPKREYVSKILDFINKGF